MPAQTAKKIIAVCFFLILLTFTIGLTYRYLTEPTAPPQRVRITNVTGNSSTISWLTEKPTRGYVLVSQKPWLLALPFLNRFFAQVFADDHGQISTVHHITLNNLKSDTTYFYLIAAGWRTYKIAQEGNIFPRIKTAEVQESPPLPNPRYGQVLKKDGITAAFPVIIYITPLIGTQREATLSTITNIEGGWALDLPPSANRLEVIIEAGKDGSVMGVYEATEATPLPTLVL